MATAMVSKQLLSVGYASLALEALDSARLEAMEERLFFPSLYDSFRGYVSVSVFLLPLRV
jgi:hypothetical protein